MIIGKNRQKIWFVGWMAKIAGLVICLFLPYTVHAHSGGTPQLTNEPAGPYRVYAWTQPEPLRAGESHVSIAVTQLNEDASAETSQVEMPVTDVDVTVQIVPVDASTAGSENEVIIVNAEHDSLLNDIYYEADTAIPGAGEWQVTIDVNGVAQTGFNVEVLPARQTNWMLVGGGSVLLILLLGLVGYLSRKQGQKQARPSTRRTKRRAVAS